MSNIIQRYQRCHGRSSARRRGIRHGRPRFRGGSQRGRHGRCRRFFRRGVRRPQGRSVGGRACHFGSVASDSPITHRSDFTFIVGTMRFERTVLFCLCPTFATEFSIARIIRTNGSRCRNESGNLRLVHLRLYVDDVALTNASVTRLTLGTLLVGSGGTMRFVAAVHRRQCPRDAAESHVRRIVPDHGSRRRGTPRGCFDGSLRWNEIVVVVTSRGAVASH
mmetsp:Transcript_28927/g.60171  ORF Transcript_28927/g.60171 Transcript_28927/m.60171 type:complete len:221 (+) Transcript_28927:1091-1753(+)